MVSQRLRIAHPQRPDGEPVDARSTTAEVLGTPLGRAAARELMAALDAPVQAALRGEPGSLVALEQAWRALAESTAVSDQRAQADCPSCGRPVSVSANRCGSCWAELLAG